MPSQLFIIGNGFDIAHGMPTRYCHFKQWLLDNKRYDVIEELQSAYPVKGKKDFLLWSEFEKALGQYDLAKVINWSWEDLYLTEESIGNLKYYVPGFLLNTRLPEIVVDAFSDWVNSIQLPEERQCKIITDNAIFISFNYTDTLEKLYSIPEQQILHIHGRASVGDQLIVGHSRYIDPAVFWDDALGVRENNERMQRLMEMNELRKPYREIIERNESFFHRLEAVHKVYVKGHSCADIDYQYFRKIKESVLDNAIWNFYPYDPDDPERIMRLINELDILYYVFHGYDH